MTNPFERLKKVDPGVSGDVKFQPAKHYTSPEEKISNEIRAKLADMGYITRKSHGNANQFGWPDLLVMKAGEEQFWIETKTKRGQMTPAQAAEFPEWEAAGAKIYILTSVDEIPLLKGPPNWRRFEHKVAKQRRKWFVVGNEQGTKKFKQEKKNRGS